MGPPWPPTEGTYFCVLGPVRALRETEPLATGSPQQRALLAALLLRDGRTATAPELIDAIWGDEPPQQALAAIRTYASRLRKALGPDVLISEAGGYAVRTGRGGLDLHVVEDLAAASERAREAGDLPTARRLLGRALSLWDGEPLTGLPGPYAEVQWSRLTDWHLELTETHVDMDLESGEHAEAASRLTALTAAHPLRERLREQLMLALYRSGRQAEALAVYADIRRLLSDELGVDPSPGLSELQQQILRADASLDAALPQESPRPEEPLRPQQLPARVPDFTGRASFVTELSEFLSSAEGRVMAVSALAGMGGVGKTTLAVHVAHATGVHFPDGQLYVDLQGAGARPAEPEAVLGSFLRALGAPPSTVPPLLDERAALYRQLLHGRRVLVLLDNARDAAQVRPLLPGTDGCAALITSRMRMVDLAGAHLVDLDVMSPEEALQLFIRIVGEERVASEREAALDVVAACGFLPLAIRIAASRLASRRTWTVSVLAAKLADERRRLDELQAGDLAVKATFELGYGQLEPAQARAFRLLGLADGPDMSLAAAAAMLDLPVEDTEDLLEALVDTSLLESAAPGRYRFATLVRLYARAAAERDEQPPSERESALSRLLDFYLATAVGVYALERPGARLVDHLEPTERRGLRFDDVRDARRWLHAEAACLFACMRQSHRPAFLRRAVDLLWIARDLGESGAFFATYEETAQLLLDAAEAQGDARATARAALVLCETGLLSGRFDAVEERTGQVLAAAREADDGQVVCELAFLRGTVAVNQERQEQAMAHFEVALNGFRSFGDVPGQGSVLSVQSRALLGLGDIEGALELAEASVGLFDGAGLSMRAADARYSLGLIHTEAGRYEEASRVLNEARSVFKDAGQQFWEGHTCLRLAQVELADDHPAEAAAYAEQALGLVDDLIGPWRRGQVLTVLGRALSALGQTDRARVCWQEALDLFEQRGSSGSTGSAEADAVRGLLEVPTG
ncbi:AfsR/SARP family transcriptional regulator [Streptomyces boluensis]|uniref:AfsR/SARP family transcriptional regulator n=1 Tax=Streptomyces boluensis TaxID=1775135 RepID=UPI0028B0970C|nr:BTAD domain-containing putative transcriptional regulator [Streptomyces boluensis]